MLSNVKAKVKIFIDRTKMFSEFYHDYKHYKKWNYNNPAVKTRASQESKILRQTHMIEKGLSLSEPRKGFGQEKIATLFDMLDKYIEMGFPASGIPFQDAISVLHSYVKFQKNLGYENTDMEERLASYDQYYDRNLAGGGITQTTKQELLASRDCPFPEFFSSRHSLRQFSDKEVDVNDIEKAIKLAQRAPSACNRQASKVYLYQDAKTNKALAELISGNTGFENDVDKYLVVTADASAFYNSFERNQLYVEAGIFTTALIEALHYYGIASCVLQNGEYYKKNLKFKNICGNIPECERIVLFVAIGYYKDEFTYALSLRKDVNDVLVIK